MKERNTISLSNEGNRKIKAAIQHRAWTQAKLADEVDISRPTVSKWLKGDAIDAEIFIKCCESLDLSWREVADLPKLSSRKPQGSKSIHTRQFEALIQEKRRNFVGRTYVFEGFEQFISSYGKGYFTVVGDPGAGKSAIAAHYVDEIAQRDCIYYFNVYSDSQNRADQFLENVCWQLIEHYALDYSELPEGANKDGVFFKELLQTVSDKLPEEEKIIIVVDALDEVDLTSQSDGANVLYLPRYLPENVYFFLTRRRELENNLLFEAPEEIFDLRDYQQECQQDIKGYISLFHEQYKDKLNQWIATQDLTKEAFVEYLAEKSENNFIYLRYIIPQIANGFYQDLSFDKLPQGLMAYYEDHWRRMGMTVSPLPRVKINIIYTLAESYEPVTRQLISEYASVDSLKVDELTVQEVLNEWSQFLHQQEIEGEICYRVYHASFIDFLHRKDVVKAAGVEIKNIHGNIANVLWQGAYR